MRRLALIASPILLVACTQQLPSQTAIPTATPGAPVHAGLVDVRLLDKDQTPVGTALAFDVASLHYAIERKPLLGLGDRDDLDIRNMEKGVDGLTHVRLQQTHDGVRVWGSDVVVHASDTTFKSVAGNLTVGLENIDVNPAVTLDEALFAAKADYATAAKSAVDQLTFSREFTELVVFPTEDGAHLAWHSTFFTEMQNDINPGLWNYFVDAKTGFILSKFNALDTLSEASGPGGNAKVSRTWTNFLDVEPSGSSYVMSTTKLQTNNMNPSQSGSGTTVSGSSLSSGFQDAAINDAHAYAKVTLAMLNDWMGYNSIDNQGFKIISRVHYSTSYENAYWDGTEMTYGDGASTFYPLSGAVDVVAHEIDHGFTQFHSNLTYSGQSGGNNESISDIAGTAAEWYDHPATANFLIGEDIFKSSTGALRNMCHQSDDGSSIDNARDRKSTRLNSSHSS